VDPDVPAYPGCPGKKATKWMCGMVDPDVIYMYITRILLKC